MLAMATHALTGRVHNKANRQSLSSGALRVGHRDAPRRAAHAQRRCHCSHSLAWVPPHRPGCAVGNTATGGGPDAPAPTVWPCGQRTVLRPHVFPRLAGASHLEGGHVLASRGGWGKTREGVSCPSSAYVSPAAGGRAHHGAPKPSEAKPPSCTALAEGPWSCQRGIRQKLRPPRQCAVVPLPVASMV